MEIKMLVEIAQQGNDEAINEIFEKYQKFLFHKAHKYFIIGGDKEDLIQEARIGLMKAIRAYDSSKASFKTFASLCITRQILTTVSSYNTMKYRALNQVLMDYYFLEENEEQIHNNYCEKYTPEDIYLAKENFFLMEKYFKENLTKLEMEIFLQMKIGYSYADICKNLNLNLKTVDNGIQRVKKKFNDYLYSSKL